MLVVARNVREHFEVVVRVPARVLECRQASLAAQDSPFQTSEQADLGPGSKTRLRESLAHLGSLCRIDGALLVFRKDQPAYNKLSCNAMQAPNL